MLLFDFVQFKTHGLINFFVGKHFELHVATFHIFTFKTSSENSLEAIMTCLVQQGGSTQIVFRFNVVSIMRRKILACFSMNDVSRFVESLIEPV